MRRIPSLTLAAFFLLCGIGRADTIYDANADFSIASNPNGVWSYGYLDVTGATYTPYASSTAAWHGNSNLEAWSQFTYDSNSYSVVGKNPTGTLQMESPSGSIAIDPGSLFFHPGNSGEKADIRFTAPSSMVVNISALYSATDTSGGNRDVHVYLNGTDQITGSFVIGSKATAPGSSISDSQTSISLNAGDHIDFAVGYGSDNVYYNDATFVSAVVTAVPEPASLALLGLGAVGLLAVARRRRTAGRAN